ncbi:MAG: hypothetical protein J5I35_07630 [Methanothrix harundinacea]|nr:hypothetical protein [Methanothrix harundinacea]
MKIVVHCRICRARHEIRVSLAGYDAWKMGALIQDALPKLSASERELLISGTCPVCWEGLFGGEDE